MATSDPFERGRAYYAYFRQGETWIPDGKPPVAIKDMDAAWRHNAAAFLVRRARNYLFLYEVGEITSIFGGMAPEVLGEEDGQPVYGRMVSTGPTPGSMAELAVESDLERARAERGADPEAWIRSTPLHKALVKGLPKEGKKKRTELAQLARHWSDCPVRTGADGACPCAGRKAEAAKAGEA